jgi:hypothetical protein
MVRKVESESIIVRDDEGEVLSSGRVLPFPWLGESRPDAGTMSVAWTRVHGTGLSEVAAEIVSVYIAALRSKVPSQEALEVVERRFERTSLEAGVRRHLVAAGGFGRLEPRVSALKERVAKFEDWASGRDSREVRSLREILRADDAMALDEYRAALEQDFESAPLSTERVAIAVESRLGLVGSSPSSPHAAVEAYRRSVDVLEAIQGMRDDFPDDVTFQSSQRRTLRWVLEKHEEAVQSIARYYSDESIVRRKLAFLQELPAFRERGARVEKLFSGVRSALESRTQAETDAADAEKASTIVVISGLSRDEVERRFLSKLEVCDQREATAKLEPALRAAIVEKFAAGGERVVPGGAFSWRIVLQSTESDLADVFATIVEDNLGAGITFIERVRQYGVDRVVEETLLKAEPTIHATGRAQSRFRINVTTLVRAMVPKGAKDLAERFEAARFENPRTKCEVEEVPGLEAIRVLRLDLGFPIGLESQNHRLLPAYERADAQDDPVHLFDFHPDHPDGRAWHEVRSLLGARRV